MAEPELRVEADRYGDLIAVWVSDYSLDTAQRVALGMIRDDETGVAYEDTDEDIYTFRTRKD